MPDDRAERAYRVAAATHLRSVKEIRGYRIEGSDGEIGHVDDFIVDDKTWTVRYLIIDTSDWWFGKRVLVSPTWIDRVTWSDREVLVGMSRDAVQNSPAWRGIVALDREYEAALHAHYERPAYWAGDHTTDGTAIAGR